MYRNKENRNTEVHGGGGLELVKPAREPASSRPKPYAFLKKPHESCPFAAPCGPRRKKNDRGQRSAFPSETSRFKPVILAHRGSALPWLVNDRAALRLRRICVRIMNGRRSGTREKSRKQALNSAWSMEMSRLTRDGTAEPVSHNQILRRELGQGIIHFPCSAS